MLKVISRSMETPLEKMIPEHKLVLAVIGGGIQDLCIKSQRPSAVQFFKGGLFETYCGLIGLYPDGTRSLLKEGGFLD